MPLLLIEKQSPQITVVTLNRPQRRNSLTIELLNELVASIKVASDQADDRVLILRGAGAAFCTGLDLKEAADQKKDTKKIGELSKKMDEMSQKLGPEYIALMDGVQDLDPNSKDGQDIASALDGLDKLCSK